MLAAPAASRGKTKNHTSKFTTGKTGATRLSLRDGFNGFLRDLPGVPGLLASVAGRIVRPAGLTPASGGQDHTTSPSAPVCDRLAAVASIASRLTFRDDWP